VYKTALGGHVFFSFMYSFLKFQEQWKLRGEGSLSRQEFGHGVHRCMNCCKKLVHEGTLVQKFEL
jgi:hypothetical protein